MRALSSAVSGARSSAAINALPNRQAGSPGMVRARRNSRTLAMTWRSPATRPKEMPDPSQNTYRSSATPLATEANVPSRRAKVSGTVIVAAFGALGGIRVRCTQFRRGCGKGHAPTTRRKLASRSTPQLIGKPPPACSARMCPCPLLERGCAASACRPSPCARASASYATACSKR